MEHLAILSKERKLLAKILSGEKTIESRWYKFKRSPYNNIFAGETVYFKDSGCTVNAKAKVERALFFENLDKSKIENILEEYGKKICAPLSFAPKLEDKNYCTLIFLKDVKKVKSFEINKTGFGNMCAWITCENVEKLKK